MSQDLLFSQRFRFQVQYKKFLKKWVSQKRILVYNLNGRDTSINSSKHGYSSKYFKSDSNITDVSIHEEHHKYYDRLEDF